MVDNLNIFITLPLSCLLIKAGGENFIIINANPAFFRLTGITNKKAESKTEFYEPWSGESVLEKILNASEEMDDPLNEIINKTKAIELEQ